MPKDTASAITAVLAFVVPWKEDSCSRRPISLIAMLPVAVTMCCSVALASEAIVLVATANGAAADVSTDLCPVVVSNLTEECGGLFLMRATV